MATLQELCDMILLMKNKGQSGKIYFYSKVNGKLRSGIITISDGKDFNINYMNKNFLSALTELRSLELTLLTLVSCDGMIVECDGSESVNIDIVLQLLKAGNQPEKAAWDARATNPIGSKDVPSQIDRPQLIQLQDEARSLLEKFYGSGATIKIDEIASYYPPAEKPREFLDQCKGLAAMMVGADKAGKSFKPLYAKVP